MGIQRVAKSELFMGKKMELGFVIREKKQGQYGGPFGLGKILNILSVEQKSASSYGRKGKKDPRSRSWAICDNAPLK